MTVESLPAQHKLLLLEAACDCLLTLGLSAETQLKARSSVPAANKSTVITFSGKRREPKITKKSITYFSPDVLRSWCCRLRRGRSALRIFTGTGCLSLMLTSCKVCVGYRTGSLMTCAGTGAIKGSCLSCNTKVSHRFRCGRKLGLISRARTTACASANDPSKGPGACSRGR